MSSFCSMFFVCISLLFSFNSKANVNDVVMIDKSLADLELFMIEHRPAVSVPVLHLFSHGQPGQLYLDGAWLEVDGIKAFLSKNMSEHIQHVNIYGCEFGQGKIGALAIADLENALNVTIAASTDITGIDGDWELEIGQPIATLQLPQYPSNLQCVTNAERMRPDCDWDMDGVLNCDDIDDDNDGVLDVEEGFVYMDINPGWLGISSGQTNQTVTNLDISSNFSLPAGTVTISCVNAHASNTGVGTLRFYDRTTLADTEFTITTTKAASLRLNHGGSITDAGSKDRFEVDDVNNYVFTGSLNAGFEETTNTTAPANTLEITKNSGANQGGTFEWKRKDFFMSSVTFTASSTNAGGDRQNYWFALAFPEDTDEDGTANSFDSDSDSDGCTDAFESAATTSEVATLPGPYGDNGLDNSVESDDTPDATVTYTSTYTSDALDNSIRNCTPAVCNPNNGTLQITRGN